MAHDDYVEVDTHEDVSHLSVREIKQRLVAAGVSFEGCVEKQELLALLRDAGAASPVAATARSSAGGGDAFRSYMKSRLGSAAALSAQYEMQLRDLSVAALKKVCVCVCVCV